MSSIVERLKQGLAKKGESPTDLLTKVANAAFAVALVASESASAQNVAKVGDHPTYSFSQPLVNGRGVKSLSDLQGRPVMVEFWGTH